MGSAIKYRVPYQVDILASDLTSGKRIGNTLYYRSGAESPPPAYGGGIAGVGDTATLLGNIKVAWENMIALCLSTKYKLSSYTMRSMLGYGYSTPFQTINALVPGGPTTLIQTPSSHGFVTGDLVKVTGVTTPSAANGVWNVLVINPVQFSIPVVTSGAWAGPGTVQKAVGVQKIIYGDKTVLASTANGGVAGDALPIFANVDVIRANSGVGKSFRSRLALAPVAEQDNDFGKLTTAAITSWATGLAFLNVSLSNGGSDPGSGVSFNLAFSKKLASEQISPWIDPGPFTAVVSAFNAHIRLGSQVQRKPRISAL